MSAALAGHHGPIINMRLSFPHPLLYRYEVGMLKVPAIIIVDEGNLLILYRSPR